MRAIVFKFIYSERSRHDNSDRNKIFMNNELFRNLKKLNLSRHLVSVEIRFAEFSEFYVFQSQNELSLNIVFTSW